MTQYKLAGDNTGYRLTDFASQLLVEYGTYDGRVFWVHDPGLYLNELQKLAVLSMDYKQLNHFINQLKK